MSGPTLGFGSTTATGERTCKIEGRTCRCTDRWFPYEDPGSDRYGIEGDLLRGEAPFGSRYCRSGDSLGIDSDLGVGRMFWSLVRED